MDYETALVGAAEMLGRLDEATALAPEPIQAGLRARIAWREASGWLACQGVWVHPLDLALRDSGLTGSFFAAQLGQRISSILPATLAGTQLFEMAPGGDEPGRAVPEDQDIAMALALARRWRRLAERQSIHPLQDLQTLNTEMEGWAGPVPDETWAWLMALSGPALLTACRAAQEWGTLTRRWPDAAARVRNLPGTDAIFVAASIWRRSLRGRRIALPFWSAPQPFLLRLSMAAADQFPTRFLACLGEAAEQALRELGRLRRLDTKAQAIPHSQRSTLPDAIRHAVLRPVFTNGSLAAAIGTSTRTALNLIDQLTDAGLLREVTNRRAWRAFTLAEPLAQDRAGYQRDGARLPGGRASRTGR